VGFVFEFWIGCFVYFMHVFLNSILMKNVGFHRYNFVRLFSLMKYQGIDAEFEEI